MAGRLPLPVTQTLRQRASGVKRFEAGSSQDFSCDALGLDGSGEQAHHLAETHTDDQTKREVEAERTQKRRDDEVEQHVQSEHDQEVDIDSGEVHEWLHLRVVVGLALACKADTMAQSGPCQAEQGRNFEDLWGPQPNPLGWAEAVD